MFKLNCTTIDGEDDRTHEVTFVQNREGNLLERIKIIPSMINIFLLKLRYKIFKNEVQIYLKIEHMIKSAMLINYFILIASFISMRSIIVFHPSSEILSSACVKHLVSS